MIISRKRLLEILPGGLAWITLIVAVLMSWKLPAYVAIFIILFDIFWFLKSLYLLTHLRTTYKEMKQNIKEDWLGRLDKDVLKRDWHCVRHLIILPMYKEAHVVVRETFEKLAHCAYPKERMMVVLALEERAGEFAQEIGRKIEAEYAHQFGDFMITTHPKDIPGELAGKGSNEAWAGEHAREVINKKGWKYEDVLASVFDVDTQIGEQYFARLTYLYCTVDDPIRAIYQPVPLFNNNVYEAPALARVISFSCTFWNMMQQSRPHLMRSFSSQSIPFAALDKIGFWIRDAVSEDSRIFVQGLLAYDGVFRVVPMVYPISMDVNVDKNWWRTTINQYKQQRRWAWGSEDVVFALDGFAKNKKIPSKVRRFWTLHMIEDYYTWAISSLLIFALGWLPVMLGGREFNDTLLSYNLPRITQYIVTISMLGILVTMFVSVWMLPPKPSGWRRRDYVPHLLQWVLTPVVLLIFGALPALDAQTRLMLGGRFRLGFWVTPKDRHKKI